ncbi:MAG: DUF4013 domain-containing protein [Methanobacteriaceae archaeon]
MELGKIFKDAFKYPTSNWKMVLIIGVLYVVSNIASILHLGTGVLGIIFAIVSLVLVLFISGYGINVIKESINKNSEIPAFAPTDNFITGIKVLVVSLIYYIIPTIVTILLAFVTGFFSKTIELMTPIFANQTIVNEIVAGNSTALTNYFNTVSPELISGLAGAFAITVIVGLILYIIFTLLLVVAQGRLADTNSLVESIKINEIFGIIGKIGWAKFILWIIALGVICFIISLVAGLILGLIPLVAVLIGGTGGLAIGSMIVSIISYLIISPYIFLFSSRALGLLYQDAK